MLSLLTAIFSLILLANSGGGGGGSEKHFVLIMFAARACALGFNQRYSVYVVYW